MKNENVEQQLRAEIADLKTEMEEIKRMLMEVHAYLIPPMKLQPKKAELSKDEAIKRYSERFGRGIKTKRK